MTLVVLIIAIFIFVAFVALLVWIVTNIISMLFTDLAEELVEQVGLKHEILRGFSVYMVIANMPKKTLAETTEVTGGYWEHQCKDGTPDLRYKNNSYIPTRYSYCVWLEHNNKNYKCSTTNLSSIQPLVDELLSKGYKYTQLGILTKSINE